MTSAPTRNSKEAVYSYGNRLFCRWSKKLRGKRIASFSWGNADTYSRYFQDYQRFIERPAIVAQRVNLQGLNSGSLILLKLDLSTFYDNIDNDRLLLCLKREYKAFQKINATAQEADEAFWTLAKKALCFDWNKQDGELAHLLKGQMLPSGLPQGMVASGFFANAYLLDFDRAMGRYVGERAVELDSVTIRLHDYCRYVDDLRLVISTEGKGELADHHLRNFVSNWVQSVLDASIQVSNQSTAKLTINEKKTELEVFSAVSRMSGIGARMKMLQHDLSGPFDMTTLQQVESGLEGLLSLAELELRGSSEDSKDDRLPSLARVSRPKIEVRDDTLTRFSAYRLTKVLRQRRSMTDMTEETESGIAGESFKHEFEVAARRLVSAWAGNPSLVQVLRYALDLFPSPELLHPVLTALTEKLSNDAPWSEKYIAWYVLAELFKAGATETGWKGADANFDVGDIQAYRGLLAKTASELTRNSRAPWYVMQQAFLYLSVHREADVALPQEPELVRHRALLEMVNQTSEVSSLAVNDAISISLVGYQLVPNQKLYGQWFRRFAKGKSKADISVALELIGQANGSLLDAITGPGKGKAAADFGLLPLYLANYLDARVKPKVDVFAENEWIPLAWVIRQEPNPFAQENALLKLANGLAQQFNETKVGPENLTPDTVLLRCSQWLLIQDVRQSNLEVKLEAIATRPDPRYATPPWCEPEMDWMYAFGRLLRAAATGDVDFTARQWLTREEPGPYSGIHSTWQKRRFGMLHTAESLSSIFAAITPWFSELLLRMLQWPGLEIEGVSLVKNWDSIVSIDMFLKLIRERTQAQASLYGGASSIPVYIYPIQFHFQESEKLRVVLVQGIVPQQEDFKKYGPLLDSKEFRARHRNHLASLVNLIHRKILAHDSATDRPHKPIVDLIVFPELSIHLTDEDLLRNLSDSTGAMLFYGVVGVKEPISEKPINVARWMIPQRRSGRRSWVIVQQGKYHLTEDEKELGYQPWRPYQAVIELRENNNPGYRMSGSICYDATDIALAADLKDTSHMFIVSAMNRDIKTFDGMISALRFHMYQHILLANTGEFGGSTAQAPYDTEHQRLIAHVHGNQQVAVSVFEIDTNHFGPNLGATVKDKGGKSLGKTPPAGLKRYSAMRKP